MCENLALQRFDMTQCAVHIDNVRKAADPEPTLKLI